MRMKSLMLHFPQAQAMVSLVMFLLLYMDLATVRLKYMAVLMMAHVTMMLMRQLMMVVVIMVQYAGMVQQSVMLMTVQISQVAQ